jgi:hypothetical protein
MSVCSYVCMFLCLYVLMSVCLYVLMSVCLYVCMSVCLRNLRVGFCTHRKTPITLRQPTATTHHKPPPPPITRRKPAATTNTANTYKQGERPFARGSHAYANLRLVPCPSCDSMLSTAKQNGDSGTNPGPRIPVLFCSGASTANWRRLEQWYLLPTGARSSGI